MKTWTYEQIIYVRTEDGTKHVIRSEEDLKTLASTNTTSPTPYSTPQTSPANSLSDVSEEFTGFSLGDPPEEPHHAERSDEPPEEETTRKNSQLNGDE